MGNELQGIVVQGEAQPTLEGNTIEANERGIAYFENAGGIARNNIIRENVRNGIAVQDQAQPTLEGNIVPEAEVEESDLRGGVNVRPGDDLVGIITTLLDGSTVRFAPGEYRLSGALNIQKTLTLVGGGPGQDDVRIISEAEGAVVQFSGEGTLTIQRISFSHEGDAWANVLQVDSGEVLIEDSSFAGAVWNEEDNIGGSGLLFVFEARGGVVRNSTIVGNRHGVEIQGQAELTLESNTIHENMRDGILLVDQAQAIINGNIIEANGRGVAYFENTGGVASNNTIRENTRVGIIVQDQAQPTLEGNTIRANESNGLFYANDGAGVARNNIVAGNAGVGIQVQDQAQPELEGNSVYRNEQGGLLYDGDAGGVARDNIVTDNLLFDIDVRDGANPTLVVPEVVEPEPFEPDAPGIGLGLPFVPGADPTAVETLLLTSLCTNEASTDREVQECQLAQLNGLAYLKNPPSEIGAGLWRQLRNLCSLESVDDYRRQAACVAAASSALNPVQE